MRALAVTSKPFTACSKPKVDNLKPNRASIFDVVAALCASVAARIACLRAAHDEVRHNYRAVGYALRMCLEGSGCWQGPGTVLERLQMSTCVVWQPHLREG